MNRNRYIWIVALMALVAVVLACSGSDGPAGPDGINAESLGMPSADGKDGTQGVAGAAVKDGVDGEKGDTGAQGVKGDTGAQGVKGDTGAQGVKGDTGAQGEKGDTGFQGVAGKDGIDGATGADGINAEALGMPSADDKDGGFTEDVLRSAEFQNCFLWVLNEGINGHVHEFEYVAPGYDLLAHQHGVDLEQYSTWIYTKMRGTSWEDATERAFGITVSAQSPLPQSCQLLLSSVQ